MQLSRVLLLLLAAPVLIHSRVALSEQLRAGVAKIDITDRQAGPVNDPSYAKALVLQSGNLTAVLIAVDAVAIGEIGRRIRNDYLAKIRSELARDPGIPPEHVLVNASHCHGVIRADVDKLTVQVVRQAWKGLAPVRVGAGSSTESRISKNRRLNMKDGL